VQKKILVSYQIPLEGLKKLREHFEVTYPTSPFFTKEELMKLIPSHHGLLSIFNRPVDKDILMSGQQLEIVSNYGVGFNNIDIETATQMGIAVCNTPEAVCEPTAELTLGLLLSLSRRISECNHLLRTNSDFEWGVMRNLGHTLRGKTLGIIGMGKIGQSVAEKARAFGMRVVYHNRKPISANESTSLNTEYLALDDLLQQSDVVSLHCPLTEATHHLIGKAELEQMKPESFLINTARGPVVNEVELVNAIKTGSIAGAALDVFEEEPKIHPELFQMQNVVLVPHIGTATIETRIEMAREAGDNFLSFWLNNRTQNLVNPNYLKLK
jgi:glyoxylate reductase